MPLVCESCGHIHWTEAPGALAALELTRERGNITSRELADEHGLTIQSASNRLKYLDGLGMITLHDERPASGGGREKVWRAV